MADRDDTNRSRALSRRQMIRASAVAGAAAWTAPAIVDSLTSPAAAMTLQSSPLLCSNLYVVFTYHHATYVMRVNQGSSTCAGSNNTSNDATFSTVCNGVTYDNLGDAFTLQADGDPITPWGNLPACSTLFTISGNVVTATDPAVTIVFTLAHNGTIGDCYTGDNGGTKPKFGWVCPGASGADSATLCC